MVAEGNSRTTKENIAVLEGDMVGQLDRDRLQAIGLNAYQISTGKSCHLDAQMVARFLHENDIFKTTPQKTHKVLFIENVGNLVCPAEFPLGEHLKVVLLSVTEGDDKPFKYPIMFQAADVVVLSKCDLLEHVNFNLERFREYMRSLNPNCPIFCLSLPQKQKAENLRSKELIEFKSWLAGKMPALEAAL
jgi:hydrogenase nickel incorporation protein HypB